MIWWKWTDLHLVLPARQTEQGSWMRQAMTHAKDFSTWRAHDFQRYPLFFPNPVSEGPIYIQFPESRRRSCYHAIWPTLIWLEGKCSPGTRIAGTCLPNSNGNLSNFDRFRWFYLYRKHYGKQIKKPENQRPRTTDKAFYCVRIASTMTHCGIFS
jgi:hypothetical protein